MEFNIQDKKLFTNALVVSLIMHAILFAALFITLPGDATKVNNQQQFAEPIKAVAIKQQEVVQQIDKIEESKRAEEQQRIDEIDREQKAVAQAQEEKLALQKNVEKLAEEQKRVNESLNKAKMLEQKQIQEALLKKQELAKQAKLQKEQQDKIKKQHAQEEAVKLAEQKRKVAADLKLKQQEELKKKKKQEELAKLAKMREQELHNAMQEELSAEQTALAAAHAQELSSEIAKYKGKIISAVSRSWIVPKGVDNKLSCQLLIHLGPGGVVLDVSTIKSSGDALLDRSAKTAVLKSSPLPVPDKSELFDQFRELRLTVRPEGILAG